MPGDVAAWYRTSNSSLGEFTFVNAIDVDDDVSARVAYATAVLSLRHPLSSDPSSLDNDLLEAALWESQRSPERARADRETIISAIEAEACSPTMIAAQSRWLSTVDEEAQPMASLIHAPMISKLSRAAGIDPVQLESGLRGFSLTRKNTRPGKRETFSAEPTTSRAELKSNIEITNNETLRTLPGTRTRTF